MEKSLLDAYQALTMPKKSGKEKSLIKRTVTEVAHEKDTASTEFTFLPPQFLAEQKMDAASKGTLFHRIFEYLPMDGTPVEETLDYLLQEKLINEEEKKLIPVDRVEKFLASDLGKEIAASPWKKRELSFTMQDICPPRRRPPQPACSWPHRRARTKPPCGRRTARRPSRGRPRSREEIGRAHV